MKKINDVKYCLNSKIEILWLDKTFQLAKVLFIEEGIERVIGAKLITDKPYKQKTLSISTLAGGKNGFKLFWR